MLCCPEVGILCIALERKEVSKMAQYVVDMQMEKQEKFYFIREKESMDIVLLPSKYLMHKKRSRISPNTIRRSAFALSYYLNYMDENQLHLDDVYQMKYAEQHEHFTDFLIWLKAGEHSREEYSKLPNNETCNASAFRWWKTDTGRNTGAGDCIRFSDPTGGSSDRSGTDLLLGICGEYSGCPGTFCRRTCTSYKKLLRLAAVFE